jgi:phosphate:Na+ symporter
MGLIEKLTKITIRDKVVKDELDSSLLVLNKLDERVSKMPRIAITNCKDVVLKMGELAKSNYNRSMGLLVDYKYDTITKIEKCENNIDKMEEVLTKYLIDLENLDVSEKEHRKITTLLKTEAEYEKIGDYAFRLYKKFEEINDKDIKFSNTAINEIEVMYHITNDAIEKTKVMFDEEPKDVSVDIEALRDFAEIKREKYKILHIKRLKKGKCSVESGISFLEILSCCESIINHCLNISIAMSGYTTKKDIITKHDYRNQMYQRHNNEIANLLKRYEKQYK